MNFIKEPNTNTVLSAYEPLVVSITENTVDETSTMTAIVEVMRDNNDRWIAIGEKQQFVYRNAQHFRFEVSEIVQRELGHDYPSQPDSNIIINQNESIGKFRVWVKHYKAGTFQTQAWTNVFYASNTIPDKPSDTDLTKFIFVDGEENEFLTRIKRQTLRPNEHLQFHFFFYEGQLGTDAQIKKYPKSGSPTTTAIPILAHNESSHAFQGKDDGSSLSSTPTLSYTGAALARVTGSDRKEYVGVSINPTSQYVEIPCTAIGDKLNFEVFMWETGNVLVTWINGTGSETFVAVDGYNTFTSVDIPSGTTDIRIENKTSSQMWLIWANTLEAGVDTIQLRRGILYIDEYDETLEKFEVWVENDDTPVSEVITVDIAECSTGPRLAWLSRRGTMEHYTFAPSQAGTKNATKTKVLSEQFGPIGESRGIRSAFSESNDVTTVFSFHEDNDVLAWLGEIVESPEVYLVHSFDNREPVDVISASFPTESKRITQGSISFRPSHSNKIQNG